MDIGLLEEYEKVLLDIQKTYRFATIKSTTKGSVLELYRYVFGSLLGWSPEKTYELINEELLKFLRLDVFLPKIPCPVELEPKIDGLFYIAEAMYPELLTVSTEERVTSTYQKVQSGIRQKFPKNFFSTVYGMEYAEICLRTAIQSEIEVQNIEELYLMFANNTWAKEWLSSCSLRRPCQIFFSSPVEFLHNALSVDEKNEALYQYVLFKTAYRKNIKKTDGKIKEIDYAKKAYEVPVSSIRLRSLQSLLKSDISDELRESYTSFMKLFIQNKELYDPKDAKKRISLHNILDKQKSAVVTSS